MKLKLRMIGILVIVLISLTGCISEENPEKVVTSSAPISTPTPTPTPSIEKLILKVGETAKTSKLEVTVLSVERTKAYQYYSDIFKEMMTEKAKPGNDFVIADVIIRNVGSDRVYVALGSFSLVDSNGYRYDPELFLGDDKIDFLQELYPGEVIRGKVLFEVPEQAIGLKIRYDFGNLFVGVRLASWEIPGVNRQSVYSTPTPEATATANPSYKEGAEPLIQIYLPKTTFKVGEEFRADYDVFNVVHNGRYDIHIYEELFDSNGRQLWPDYDIGRETGSISGSKLHYYCTTKLTKPGIFTLRVTIHDYVTNKVGYAEVKFEVVE